jgi:hypothetical protein
MRRGGQGLEAGGFLIPYMDVALLLQIDEGGQCPEVELDFGLDGFGVDFGAHDALAADVKLDAGFGQALNERDVGIVGAVVGGFPGVVVNDDVEGIAVEDDGDLAMAGGDTVFCQSVDVFSQANEQWVGVAGFFGSGFDVEDDFVGGVWIGQDVGAGYVDGDWLTGNGQWRILGVREERRGQGDEEGEGNEASRGLRCRFHAHPA